MIHVAERIQSQNRNGAAVRPAHSFDALHRGSLPGAVWADQAEDLALVDFERNLGDGHRRPVGLADAENLDDWVRSPGDVHCLPAGHCYAVTESLTAHVPPFLILLVPLRLNPVCADARGRLFAAARGE